MPVELKALAVAELKNEGNHAVAELKNDGNHLAPFRQRWRGNVEDTPTHQNSYQLVCCFQPETPSYQTTTFTWFKQHKEKFAI